eukprot:m.357284 g.357284  ORF g.357284 m.357284 type:complete len:947 (+) comp17775_c0_seq1:102-2942(+)
MAQVRVAVRVRPLNSREIERKSKLVVDMRGQQTVLFKDHVGSDDFQKFTFDHSYWSFDKKDSHYATQEEVFNDLGGDVLKSAFDGFNACVFAYGQTGAGKSYTMMGYGEEIGLIPRICEALFQRVEAQQGDNTKFSVTASYLEIYNEKVKDLLVTPGAKKSSKALRVREHPKTGPFVDGLSTHDVVDYQQIDDLMELGNQNRTTAATGMNDTSSRSHAVFTLIFKQMSFINGVPAEKTSKINLVDLAGSERTSSTGATGLRLKEGGNINKSLTTLGLCISALAERSNPKKKKKEAFIPYRDSVLTWLLKDSLGGNSKTIMVAAISPADINHPETLSTLHYANRAKNIVNKPIVNEDENVRIIRELRAEVDRLKELLGGEDAVAKLQTERDETLKELGEAVTEEEKEVVQAKLAQLDSQMETAKSGNKEGLAQMLQMQEQMMNAMVSDWKGKFDSMAQIFEDRALGLSEKGRALTVESQLPHFVSLNLDDPLVTGIVLYYVHDGDTVVGQVGAEPEPDICLEVSDILPHHCLVHYDGTVVTLTPTEGAEVLVNGGPVVDAVELHQGATVQLGHETMFRFNHPVEARMLREKREAEKAEGKEGAADGFAKFTSPARLLSDKMRQDKERLAKVQAEVEALQQKVSVSETERAEEAERLESERREREEQLLSAAMERARLEQEILDLQDQERDLQEKTRLELAEQRQKMEEEQQARFEEERRLYREQLEREYQERLQQKLKVSEEELVEIKKTQEVQSEEQQRQYAKLLKEKEDAVRAAEAQRAETDRMLEETKRIEQEKEQLAAFAAAPKPSAFKQSAELPFDEVWHISIPEYRERGSYVVFKVMITLLGESWCLWRRYSHFEELHKQMESKMRTIVSNISFPKKHSLSLAFKKKPDDEFLANRARKLEAYLINLVSKTRTRSGSPFYEVDRSILERTVPFFRNGAMER